jgi:hypothetical protein
LDALELVEREHARLDAGLGMLLGAAPQNRDAVAKRVLRRLSAYLLAEEQCMYPALFVTLGSKTPLEPLTDHLTLKGLVAELLRMEAHEASFAACVSNLQDRLRGYRVHHEHCLFPLMRGTFSPGELQLIGGEMQLFLGANRRVGAGSSRTAKALLEEVRRLRTGQRQDETAPGHGTQTPPA